jgi:CRISPR-associated protein Csm4
MRTYRVKLKPAGAWCTPWHADTLFAALCWQVRSLDGESELRRMLRQFCAGEPPFVLSDAFPDGWLPCPLSAKLQELPQSNVQSKPPAWVPEGRFRAVANGNGGAIPAQMDEWPEPIGNSRNLHASIDRRSGTCGSSGRLFEIETSFLQKLDTVGSDKLALYLRSDDPERVARLLHSLSTVGFGKKRSSGKGGFKLEREAEPCNWMDDSSGANAFVSLSHFVPSSQDPGDGCWRLLTKYPKFSPGVPAASPFKGRLVMLRPGSVFRTTGPVRHFYGTMLTGISQSFPEAVHYGLCFPVPIRWPEEEV